MNDHQIERYARHILLPNVGGIGQQRLLDARVAVVGDGPGAETAAQYLCAGGVGTLRLDSSAARAWKAALNDLNPDVAITTGGDVDLTVTPEDNRVSGAMAAQRAMVTLSGAANPDDFPEWTSDHGGFAWG